MHNIDPNEFKKYAVKHMGISSLTVDNYMSAISNVPNNMTPNIIEERQMNVACNGCFFKINDG